VIGMRADRPVRKCSAHILLSRFDFYGDSLY
jgi:hypothetical protein